MAQTGIDISKKRLDNLDKKIISFGASPIENEKIAIDIGCGFAKVSIVLAIMGWKVYLYDKRDLETHFKEISKVLNLEDKLIFRKMDLRNLSSDHLPDNAKIIIAQRVLHYFEFKKAQDLLKIITDKLMKEGRMFASFSGIDSKLGDYYKAKNLPIGKRYDFLSQQNQDLFDIKEKIALYSKEEVLELFRELNLKLFEISLSKFANVQSVFQKK